MPCVDLSHEDSHQKAQQELRRIAVRQTKGKRTDQDAEPNTDTVSGARIQVYRMVISTDFPLEK